MAVKPFDIEGVGQVFVYKRKGSRSLRISISADGLTKVTIPYYAPYTAGVAFAKSRTAWILEHKPAAVNMLHPGDQIGKAHRLVSLTSPSAEPYSRIVGSEIRIHKPAGMLFTASTVQAVAEVAAVRALRLQSSKLLPVRLRTMAEKYSFNYTDVHIKRLKGRWGSCDNQRRIVLNLYLMQLPWDLIDYVLLHELVHTKHMNHGKDFWDEFERHEPKAKQLRNIIKKCRPVLSAVDDRKPMQ